MEEYHLPSSLDEALHLLENYRGEARVIAGGTDLVIQLKKGERKAKALVDLSDLLACKQIKREPGYLRVGALCTHAQIAGSSLVKETVPALAEAAASVGSPQIRNVGTVGGNIVSAQPAADTSIALTALGARLTAVSAGKQRNIPLQDAFLGVGRSALDPSAEVLTEILIPLKAEKATSSFSRLSRRKALSLPVLNTAVALVLSADLQFFEEVCIAVGPVATVPWRAKDAEALLQGARISEKAVREACLLAAEKAAPRNSLRGSAGYRKEMVNVFVYRSIQAALRKLGCDLNG